MSYKLTLRTLTLVSTLILALSLIPTLRRLTLLTHHIAPTMTYTREQQIALLAVQRAAILTKAVYKTSAKGTLSKSDASPVTVGDFGAQALIISALKHNFPDDEIVAEEEASDLRSNTALRDQIWAHVQETRLQDEDAEKELGGPIPSVERMVDVIDMGGSKGGASGRIWTIDPIDGTKGFLRGGQYAVCLALLVDGQVKVGVLGCPNLPVDDTARLEASIGQDQTDEGKGVLFSAIEGQGALSRPLTDGPLADGKKIAMRGVTDIAKAIFCESVEAGHSSHGDQAAIAKKLGITNASVRMDSQAKYGSIARGAGDLYLRLPVSQTYQEKIWDHAAGVVIVNEAGGKVTDVAGKPLDFSKGRTLADNKGVVAAPKDVHEQVLAAVKDVLGVKA